MEYVKFAINENPYCIWGYDLRERNEEFLRGLDPKFFEYAARSYQSHADGEDGMHAAMALRSAYSHGLETLFALLGATVQAPDCVYGWIAKYRVNALREVVEKISQQRPVMTELKLVPLSWERLADAIHSGLGIERADELRAGFGRAWRRFAHEFLDAESQEE